MYLCLGLGLGLQDGEDEIVAFLANGCIQLLVTAYASAHVMPQIPKCGTVGMAESPVAANKPHAH